MKATLLALCLLTVAGAAVCQEAAESRTLTQQYKSLNSEMEVINGYRTVKLFTMDKFWGTVMDSLNAERSAKEAAQTEVAALKAEIASLKTRLDEQASAKSDLQEAVDNLRVAGMSFSKGAYVTGSFIVTAALLTLLVLALLSTRMSYRAVKDMKRLYENTNLEFERYKHNAVEKEIKLSRELQDYRNRYTEVSSN